MGLLDTLSAGCTAPEDATGTTGGAEETAASASAGNFDFYVLSLSWSPSYCAREGDKADRRQCGRTPPFGFIVHGLWPQYEHGYPKDCRSAETPKVPVQRMQALADIMPGYGLIIHEWRTHGTCTGLGQEDYFADLRAAYERIVVPDDIPRVGASGVRPADVESAFLRANPGMGKDGVSVDCDRRYLREVRICLTRDMRFRSCPEVDRATCRLPRAEMPPAGD